MNWKAVRNTVITILVPSAIVTVCLLSDLAIKIVGYSLLGVLGLMLVLAIYCLWDEYFTGI